MLIARLRRLASFSNPVFFKTQGYLFLPRGCYDEVIDLLGEQNITIDIDDKRQLGNKLKKLKFLWHTKKRSGQSS